MRPVDWEQIAGLPQGPAALLAGIQLADARGDSLRRLPPALWDETLSFCDRSQLTLLLADVPGLPPEIQRRVHASLARNTERDRRLCAALFQIATRLEQSGIEYVLLKGFSHDRDFTARPHRRPQYDIDLYLPQRYLTQARDQLAALGYEPLARLSDFPTDHLPVMIRKTGWEWRGDFFDPEIPPSVDLHFRFWDAQTECLALPGLDEFWQRRETSEIYGRPMPVLHIVDRLGYASIHLLRHLLRASLRIYHVYELAWFLNRRAGDGEFWEAWRTLHPPALRQAETISFRLAWKWFGGRIPPAVEEEFERLDADVREWLELRAAAPVETLFRPNKSELWLHLALVGSARDRWRVARRRLFPLRLPGPVDAVYVPEAQMTLLRRLRKTAKYCAYLLRRSCYHGRALASVLAEGLVARPFWSFLLAANLYNFGLFIFFLLYNLHLLDAGFEENLLGLVTGAMTAGTLAGSLAAAAVSKRFGLKRSMVIGCVGAAVAAAVRVVPASRWGLVVSAFVAGAFSAVWMVALAPAVACLVPEGKRPRGFSLWLGSGIATGIVAGLVGSRLPAWLGSKPAAIWVGCAISLLAVLPLLRLRLPHSAAKEGKIYPKHAFVYRYLLAFAVWQIAIGAFNPLFNAYFSRALNASVERIGIIFAGSQFAQASAVLAAPVLLRRVGMVTGISVTQMATAACLAMLATVPPLSGAAVLYAAYMSFQVMGEPGMFSILMNRTAPAEHAGASALNFFVMFACQAIAAISAGWLTSAFGYSVMLVSAAVTAAAAGLLFRAFVGEE